MGSQDVHVFTKTKEYVLEMLGNCLSGSEEVSSRQELINCAEMILEPVDWVGIWRLSKETCRDSYTRYPCSVEVTINGMDFTNLTASVLIDPEINESLNFPECVPNVPIIDLWALIKQPNNDLKIEETARFIDLLRFFFDNIWWPWDSDNECYQWKMIEDRVGLWAESATGVLPASIIQHVKEIREEAIFINSLIINTENNLSQFENDDDDQVKLPYTLLIKLGKLHARFDYLRTHFLIYESPHLRKSYIEELDTKNISLENKAVQVVWKGGSVKYLEYIYQEVTKIVDSDAVVTISDNLSVAFKKNSPKVVIFEGTYSIPRLPLTKLYLRGLGDVILDCDESRNILLNLTNDTVLHTLKLNTSNVNNMIAIQGSHNLHMTKCTLETNISDGNCSVMVDGILVVNGGTLVMEDCSLFNFYTGLFIKKGGKVQLLNCLIENCGIGIQMCSGSEVTMENCKLIDCSENAIRFEQTGSGPLPEMKSVPGLTITNCQFIGNNENFVAISLSDFSA